MKNKGFTLVEVMLAIGIISIMGIGIAMFLRQTYVFKDEVDAQASTQRTTQLILERLSNTVYQSSSLNITNGGTILTALKPDGCEVYSLVNQIIYYDSSSQGQPCPSITQLRNLHDINTKITNLSNPPVVLFTGLPSNSDATAVFVRIRSHDIKDFANDEFYIEQTMNKRL